AGGAKPVLPGQIPRVPDPEATLLGRVDEEEAAERPERLAAQRLRWLLVDDDHPLPRVGELHGGDEPGQAGAHDDRVCVVSCHGCTGWKHGAEPCSVAALRRGDTERWVAPLAAATPGGGCGVTNRPTSGRELRKCSPRRNFRFVTPKQHPSRSARSPDAWSCRCAFAPGPRVRLRRPWRRVARRRSRS